MTTSFLGTAAVQGPRHIRFADQSLPIAFCKSRSAQRFSVDAKHEEEREDAAASSSHQPMSRRQVGNAAA
eukprot:CAMPEP_0196662574 /NCGR_PEP_ID=MMETSP1086-20130531/49317_1 /TAXON_ID=77921 /ORGANISM="Cyanoptyche  gloeocystis , Strain SAG4.97" /LENGTH=69 /DNA_ID=CAMNT_0041998033 /DNA_START=33 /DNA_END=239 /DNA_ORIENTATION=+